jgi:hypothetical protein
MFHERNTKSMKTTKIVSRPRFINNKLEIGILLENKKLNILNIYLANPEPDHAATKFL